MYLIRRVAGSCKSLGLHRLEERLWDSPAAIPRRLRQSDGLSRTFPSICKDINTHRQRVSQGEGQSLIQTCLEEEHNTFRDSTVINAVKSTTSVRSICSSTSKIKASDRLTLSDPDKTPPEDKCGQWQPRTTHEQTALVWAKQHYTGASIVMMTLNN